MAVSQPQSRRTGQQAVVLYGKPGCHLCEDAEELLEILAERIPLTIQRIDITGDLPLFEQYKYVIPVVQREDGVTVEGRIQLTDLEALLT